jgi:hypothetical protein
VKTLIDSTVVNQELVLTTAEAMALPRPTPSKVYGMFKLLRYETPNENRDGFHKEDVADTWQTIKGSDVNLMHDSLVRMGTVIDSDDSDEGIMCVAALLRKSLKAYNIDPKELPDWYTASMEVRFDKRE